MRFINGSLIKILISILIVTSAYAEEKIKVYRDQYVVETKVLGASLAAESSEFSQAGAKIIKRFGNNKRLISPAVSNASISNNDLVDYDPKSDYCYELLKSGLVESCSPNYELKALVSPNDSSFSQLWGMSSTGIDAVGAWDLSTGSSEQVVAVIDTGVDYTHNDLQANIWNNPAEILNGIDDDANGYIDDLHGINAITSSGDPMDDNGHGTHCAGTIGGVANNGLGVAGVNWNVKIMGLKFLASNGSGSLMDAVEAIDYLVMMKNRGVNVRLVNNSWGGGGYSEVLFNAIKSAEAAGIIFLAAAGNSSSDNDLSASYPASYEVDNVVSVAAIDSNQNLAGFSNYGLTSVDIAAPGVGILSTTPNNSYAVYNGTSMATPHVTGALALLLSHQPTLSNQEAIQRLYASGLDRSTLSGLVSTSRSVNVARMLRNETAAIPNPGDADPCSYSQQEYAYNPDHSADNARVVIDSDELSYHTVNLPFGFPFQGEFINKIIVSPNGVIYLKTEPDFMDFKNGQIAPRNAIAAFHSDLNPSNYGVRVKTTGSSVTVYWKATHYAYPNAGYIEVRTTLDASGTVSNSVKISNDSLASALGSLVTIGITGKTSTKSARVESFTNQTTRVFSPSCVAGNIAQVTQVNLSKLGKRNSQKSKVRIDLRGNGTGLALLQFKFGSYTCKSSKIVNITNGNASFTSKLNSAANFYKSLTVSSSAAKSKIKLNSKADKHVPNNKLKSACAAVIRNLK